MLYIDLKGSALRDSYDCVIQIWKAIGNIESGKKCHGEWRNFFHNHKLYGQLSLNAFNPTRNSTNAS